MEVLRVVKWAINRSFGYGGLADITHHKTHSSPCAFFKKEYQFLSHFEFWDS